MGNKIYRVCGEDTYAHESFIVQEYNNREEAEVKLKECRDSVMDQCEELRDSFWIAEITQEQKIAETRLEAKLRSTSYSSRHCDMALLDNHITTLLKSIWEQLSNKKLGYDFVFIEKNFDADAKVIPQKKNCYTALQMKIISNKDGSIYVDYYVSLHCIVANRMFKAFATENDFRCWLKSEDGLTDTRNTTIELIDKFIDEDK